MRIVIVGSSDLSLSILTHKAIGVCDLRLVYGGNTSRATGVSSWCFPSFYFSLKLLPASFRQGVAPLHVLLMECGRWASHVG